MLKDNITLIVSFISLLVAVMSSLITFRKHLLLENIKLRKIEINHKLREEELKYKKSKDIELYVEELASRIKEIYPKSDSAISIKLVEKSYKQNPSESEVITLVYPNKKYNIKMPYKIKDNTDFNSIVKDSKEYFFVSDLKKYSALKKYVNSDRHFMQEYNTSIVVPIQKNSKGNENIIGFLCINSSQKLGNVKKNKKLMDVVKPTASLFYDYLTENKLVQEAITIKK